MTTKLQLTKRPNEKFPIGLIYESPDLDEGASIISCTITISPTVSEGLKVSGSPLIDGNEVSQVVYAGEAGVNYNIVFKVTTSEGNVFEDAVYVKVREVK